MIVSRRTAKNLNWAGAVVLACLGLALLPVPVRAQQPTPDKVVPIQVQPAKKTPMSVDEQIETLRRLLQQLEEQKRKEQGPGAPSKPAQNPSPWPANWKEINEAIEETNRLMRDVEHKHATAPKHSPRADRQARVHPPADRPASFNEILPFHPGHRTVEPPDNNPGTRRVLPQMLQVTGRHRG